MFLYFIFCILVFTLMLVLEHILVRVLARVQHGVRHRQPSPHSSGSSLHLQHSFLLSVKPSSPAIGVWNLYVAFGCPSLRDGIAFSRFMAGSDEETGESCLARRWSKQTLTQRVPSSPSAHFGSRRFLSHLWCFFSSGFYNWIVRFCLHFLSI